MSEHSLPPDPSSWPRDPFRLLGVPPGASARDLRKAYLRLIRSYKPEHAPEEFRRIRDAYESALPFAGRAGPEAEDGLDREAEPPSPDEPRVDLTPGPSRAEAIANPWDLARAGEFESAYRALLDRQDGGRASEADYLGLYWLLALAPALEPGREAVDWLIRGLGARGADAPRLRELFRRELAADPALALSDRLEPLLKRRTPPPLAVDVAEARWRAARRAGRRAVIADDLDALRPWLLDADESAWARLLLAASLALAWAEGPGEARPLGLAREFDRLGGPSRAFAADLDRLEYALLVRDGVARLGGFAGMHSATCRLLALSWDEPTPESRSLLRAYVARVEQAPEEALRLLDDIRARAPVVLGRLAQVLGGLEFEGASFFDAPRRDEVAPALRRLLDAHPWDRYRAFRPTLLAFCLREVASPGLVARALSGRPEFILTGKAPLAQALLDDWPLRLAYRAAELARASPLG